MTNGTFFLSLVAAYCCCTVVGCCICNGWVGLEREEERRGEKRRMAESRDEA